MGAQSSRLRRRILDLAKHYQVQIDRVLSERGPMIRGSFGTRARVCGAPGCRCTRGELHESKYLSATDQGKVRQVHVPAAAEGEVAAGVGRYQRFRKTRVRLAELIRQQLALIDELGQSLLKPYPPDRPLPPAKRRGRSRQGGSHEPP